MYVESQADYAFTLWLATRDVRKVKAELHNHMTGWERKAVTTVTKRQPKRASAPKQPKRPKQQFTEAQLQAALNALNNREKR